MFRKNVCVAGEHGETGFVSNFMYSKTFDCCQPSAMTTLAL